MALFQQSVQKKYIAELDKYKVAHAYQRLIAHFGNPVIQENIRHAKEEQYQEGFLRELLVDVFGYTLNPQPYFNLTTEQKNEKNSKKADGAILKNGKPIAVIELKSVKTTDLQAVELQAFNYKVNQTDCVYVITSNFQKIRFYIENAVDFEEFDLFNLSKERFMLLYLCLHVDNVLSNLPLHLKKASIEKEESITKKLYNDYAAFKKALYADVTTNHKGIEALILFKKTQKLLDRFLFIFFAEDKGLLPPNTVLDILNQWEQLKKLDAYCPLYHRFKRYFGYLNEGRKGEIHDIFAYNGGLFAPDEVLDSFTIADNILENHCRVMSSYDFDTEVDTNILGHIFEHSLSEIDGFEQKSEQKKVSKRKKDGIFYTPRYITKHIVAQTIGTLCQAKKLALHLDNEALVSADTKKDRDIYQQKINTYREWLLQLTILDPACGSGAFLNEALVFLIEEHRLIDSMTATILENTTSLTDNVMTILENNIFGVDINEESVEISRLSLWLRTAKVGRKLNDLSRNIKCGNSLIQDVQIALNFAFDWQAEFPQVFEKGGFDVIIGNPPYVRQELLSVKQKEWLVKNYEVGNGAADLYTYFYEKSLNLLRENGTLGFITPNKFIKAGYGKKLRNYLSGFQIREIVDFGELPVFADAATFPCIVVIDKKPAYTNTRFAKIRTLNFSSVAQAMTDTAYWLKPEVFKLADWQMANEDVSAILEQIRLKGTTLLEDYTKENIFRGVLTGFNEAFVINKATKDRLIKDDPKSAAIIKPFLTGDDVRFYKVNFQEEYLIFTKRGININNYPAILKHLEKYEKHLIPGTLEGRKVGNYKWYEIQDSSEHYLDFEKNKIIYPEIAKESRFMLDKSGFYTNNKVFIIPVEDYFLLALLNSKLIWLYLKNNCAVLGDEDKGGRLELRSIYLKQTPIAIPSDEMRAQLAEKAKAMLELTADLQRQSNSFLSILKLNMRTLTISKKLENWYLFKFIDFRDEVAKQKIEFPMKDMAYYVQLFTERLDVIEYIQMKISHTEYAINQLVYQLYELSPDAIDSIEK
jgi:type I restriction-modification system DNA methylase subunit